MPERKKGVFCGLSPRIVFVVLEAAVMALIFFLSAQDGQESRQFSDSALQILEQNNLESMVLPGTLAGYAAANIRKWAHVYLYALLGFFLPQALACWRFSLTANLTLSVAVAFVYSCTDELHQWFVPGRAALWSDLGVDALGYLPAIGISFALLCLWRKRKTRPPA